LELEETSTQKARREGRVLAADLEAKGKSLRFAMNGGMYQGDFRPVGLIPRMAVN
jgi:uncharacterized protein YigE (DUF2233 family)